MKSLYRSILFFTAVLFGMTVLAQTEAPKTIISPQVWQQMKAAGTLTADYSTHDPNAKPAPIQPQVFIPNEHSHASPQTNNPCNCMQQVYPLTGPDSTGFMVVPDTYGSAPLYSNDDGSSPMINLPFTFCFYGNNYTSCYINNNGNISFGNAYGIYSPVGLQGAAQKMVDPFWADVDTRPSIDWSNHPAGIVFYKLTPHALIVRWDSVGWYGMHTDKLTDFQAIITDGQDPLIQGGNNVKFCYGVMQWTTGDASSGTNGFVDTVAIHGSPAAVGATNADNSNYIQFGLFGRPGSNFTNPNPPFPYDRVRWLENQTFQFSTCSGNNVPPVVVGLQYCDTLRMCVGDTLRIPVHFESPEANQITHDTAWYSGTGFTIVWDSSGNEAGIMVQIIGDSSNVGNNTLTFKATDNGSPVGTTIITVDIKIDSFNAPRPIIHPVNPTICANQQDSIWVVNPNNYTFFSWNTGATTNNIWAGTGDYSVTVTAPNGCRRVARDTITVYPGSIPVISGNPHHCPGDSSVLSVPAVYVIYTWSNGATTSTIHIDTGTVTVTVQDANGCIGTSLPVTVFATSVLPELTGTPHVCGNDTSHLVISPTNFNSYSWSNGSLSPSIWVHGGWYRVTVTDTANCVNVDSFYVRQTANPVPQINGPTVYCGTDNVTLVCTPSGMATYSWSNGSTNQTDVFSYGFYHITVTDTSGCQGTDSVIVVQHPRPTPHIVGDTAFCAYDSTLVSTDSSYVSYLWSNGNTTRGFYTNISADYTVTVTNSFGCTGFSNIFHTTVNPVPNALFSILPDSIGRPDTIIHFTNHSIVASPAYNNGSNWSFGDGNFSNDFNATHMYQRDGIYIVRLINTTNEGCQDTTYMDYIIQSVPVIAPNVFTPNSDGHNDVLVFEYLWQYNNSRLEVFNRWGFKIYDNYNYKNDWNGDNHPDGTYYYILYVTDLRGTVLKGTINILRGK